MRVFWILFLLPLMSSGQMSKGVELLGHWTDTSLPINYSDARFNEVFGFKVNGGEYAVIGSTTGSHIISVPYLPSEMPQEVDFVPGPQQGEFVVHRDFDVYDNHLFMVGDQAPATLQIADLSYLPDSVHVVYDSDELFSTAHNIRIDYDHGRAYVCGPAGGALMVLDISNPAHPQKLVDFTALDYVHDCFVRDNIVYMHAAAQGMWIFDMSNPAQPIALGSLTDYPQQGYNHSGWMDASGTRYVMADENEGLELKMLDVSSLTDIEVTDTFGANSAETSIPHNVMIVGDLAYVSHYFDGLQIFDISNIDDVQRYAWYDTSNTLQVCCYGMWGVYPFLPSGKILGSDRQNGLYIFRLENDPLNEGDIPIVYGPNPGTGLVEFEFKDLKAEEVFLEVYDLSGRLTHEDSWSITTEELPWAQTDMTNLPNGQYVLSFRSPTLPFSQFRDRGNRD